MDYFVFSIFFTYKKITILQKRYSEEECEHHSHDEMNVYFSVLKSKTFQYEKLTYVDKNWMNFEGKICLNIRIDIFVQGW